MALTKVSTPGIKDEAITLAKLLHGDSNNDGKFLRANNGADPTFETVTGTTINNNASTRFITGTNNANELDAESNLTVNGSLITFSSSTLVVDKSTNPTISVKETVGNKEAQFRADTTGGLIRTVGSYPLVLGTNQTERMRIDSSGKVGIGVTNPNTILHIQGNNNNGDLEALRLHNNQTGGQTKTSIGFTNTTQADYEHAKITATRDNAGRLDFFVGAQSHAVLCVDGYASGVVGINTVQASKALDVNGEIRTNSGILFGSDTAAANTLDDYEEGTWTPTIRGPGGTGTHGAGNAGFYTKIGNVVHVHATVHWTAISGTTNGVVQILGLPYATKNASSYRSTSLLGGQVVGVHNGNNASMNIAIGVDPNQSFVYVTGVNGSTTGSYNYTHQPTVNSTGQIFGFAMTYLTS